VIAPTDEEVLKRLVDTATFRRGADYARKGAVRMPTWSLGRTRVVGEVKGTEPVPYSTSVELTRSASGRLSGFRGTCTCPVGVDCKHAVALVLADDASGLRSGPVARVGRPGGGDPPDPPKKKRATRGKAVPAWELPLQALIEGDDQPADGPEPAGIGLQFEVVEVPVLDSYGPSSARASRPSILIRPVVHGHSGNWVRSGISWGSFNYLPIRRARGAQPARRLLLMEELLALTPLSGPPS